MFDEGFCNICGKRTEYLSKAELFPGYESEHDSEDITLDICGQCIDSIFHFIEERRYNCIKDYVGDEQEARQIQKMLNNPHIDTTIEFFNRKNEKRQS